MCIEGVSKVSKIDIVLKVCIWVARLVLRKNDSWIGGSFWQKGSLITHKLFELYLFWYLAQSTYLWDTLYYQNCYFYIKKEFTKEFNGILPSEKWQTERDFISWKENFKIIFTPQACRPWVCRVCHGTPRFLQIR